MQPISTNPLENIVFIALLVLWLVLLGGGFIFGRYATDTKHRMPRWTRLTSSLVLVIASWFWFLIVQDTPYIQIALWFAIGMTLGFLGDLCMARIFPLEQYVLAGMVAFGLSHIAYIVGMTIVGRQLDIIYPRWNMLLVWWAIGLIGWFVVVFYRSKATLLHVAALPYALLLASTTGIACGLFLEDKTFMLVALGAVLFLASDLLLAADLFDRVHFPYIGDIVWLAYGPGQMFIISGLFLKSVLLRS